MSTVFADGTLVRESSKPETYVVYGGKRMLVYGGTATNLAQAMGLNLSMTRVVPDGSLSSIPILKLESASLTPPSLVFPPDNQGGKFSLNTNGSIRLITQGKEIRIAEIRGWLRSIHGNCDARDPDWHYYLDVDPEWAESTGIDLNQILKVGNIIAIAFLTELGVGQSSYSPFATIAIPCINVELNGWRGKTADLPDKGYFFTTRPKPADWNYSNGEICPNSYGTVWPYDPLNPIPNSSLPPGSHDKEAPYVSISGSILTDNPHLEDAQFATFWARHVRMPLPQILRSDDKILGDQIRAVLQMWGGNKAPTDATHPSRWTEIHPPDLIKVLHTKESPKQPKETVRGIAVIAANGLAAGEARSFSADIYPPSPRPPSSRVEVKEHVGMETNFRTIIEGNANKNGARITIYDDHVNVYVRVQGEGGWGAPGKFKAIYRVKWIPSFLEEPQGNRWSTNNLDGRLEVFLWGTNNAVYHIWQLSAGGTWSAWYGLGGTLTGNPAVGRNADGRLEVFTRASDNALYHIWQLSAGGTWSAWYGLGGTLTGNPAVGRNADGRLEVFTRASDNALYHIWQLSAGGTWSAWYGLGGTLTGNPAVGRNADGRLEVFTRASDNALYHIWQLSAGGTWSAWYRRGKISITDPVMISNADGRLEVFFTEKINNIDVISHIWQLSPGGAWYGGEPLGWYISNPQVIANADGRLEVFAIKSSEQTLYHIWQLSPGGRWSEWHALGGINLPNQDLGVTRNADGRIEVFARAFYNSLVHIWQLSPGGTWSAWYNLRALP